MHFVGGAVLGSYPHIAYDAFLSALCDGAGVAVVATPYELGTDHGAISAKCQRDFARLERSARAKTCRATRRPCSAGHSLGCKLQLLAACDAGEGATQAGDAALADAAARAGHFFVAFNNATAADSVRLLEKFARERSRTRRASLRRRRADERRVRGFTRNLPSLTALAEKRERRGPDFTPGPEETLNARSAGSTPACGW